MTALEKTLLHCLIEEHSANGGQFASPDTDFWVKQLGEFSETTTEIFKRLLQEGSTIDQDSNLP